MKKDRRGATVKLKSRSVEEMKSDMAGELVELEAGPTLTREGKLRTGNDSPASHEWLTRRQVAEALLECCGLIDRTAARLGVTRRTITNYLRKYPKLREFAAEGRRSLIDECVGVLADRMRGGSERAAQLLIGQLVRSADHEYLKPREAPGGGTTNFHQTLIVSGVDLDDAAGLKAPTVRALPAPAAQVIDHEPAGGGDGTS